ncbi:MAG: hypothetical protein CM15mP49_31140 [Actinomycetota bacterium]|nr:MAG: hypothetical protein CM15mP49_31140 [Actinomycetota bacterium]
MHRLQKFRSNRISKGESVRDLTAVVLDRPRHDDLISELREAGARIRLIPDGDVAGAISTAWPDSGADILFGIGGTPEGVIAAAHLSAWEENFKANFGQETKRNVLLQLRRDMTWRRPLP